MKTQFNGNPNDTFYAQRQELLGLLEDCARRHEPLIAMGEIQLRPDEIHTVLHKINNKNHFSGKERKALTEAGFNVKALYPGL